MATQKRKVAILGGGVGGMTAAYELSEPGLRDELEVTVYQQGWRLGGKGASGRNRDIACRIEEHGPHVWCGLYDNAFRVMRNVYEELDRPPGAPLATWEDAFQPLKGTVTLMEEYAGEWFAWTPSRPKNDELPGDEDAKLLLPFWDYVGEAMQMLRHWFRQSQHSKHDKHRASDRWERIVSTITHGPVIALIETFGLGLDLAYGLARLMHGLLDRVGIRWTIDSVHRVVHTFGGVVLYVVRAFVWLHWRRVRNHLEDADVRMHWAFLNLGVGLLHGIHKDRVIFEGFEAIDHMDFREWLSQHIVYDPSPLTKPTNCGPPLGQPSLTLNSPLALFLYQAGFGFDHGDLCEPKTSAGVGAYMNLRLALTWKGALVWAMHAGMGDVVFAPMYEVLKKRGVRFEFFHKVTALKPSADGKRIESIKVGRQADLADGKDCYDPLMDVKGLPCWPSEPDWDQLNDGASYRDTPWSFEDWYSPIVASETLERGTDFDDVVLAISLGAHPYVCGDLIEARPEWKAMVESIGTVRTQNLQIWLDMSTKDAGWPHPGDPIISGYDASHLHEMLCPGYVLEHEDWPENDGTQTPRAIAYVTGSIPGTPDTRGKIETAEQLSRDLNTAMAREGSLSYLQEHVFRIFPNAMNPNGFDWDRLVDQQNGVGPDRIDSQYYRANVQPSDRFVQSLPGTTQFRLRPDDSKYENLVLAGDWTWTPLNSGCVEAATISGMLAANALTGSPSLERIVGLTFGYPKSPYTRAVEQGR